MSSKKIDFLTYAMAMLLGAAIFVAVYGINVLNPLYDDWLMSRVDLAQHYLGWCFYRNGNWAFPIGFTDNLAYPMETSVIFTDSIPLFAVIFKILSPILPETFQYFGLWGIMSFMLQGLFAVKILREFSLGSIQSLVGSVFFIISPTVIEKMFRHTALGGHWLILAAIYLFVRHGKDYLDILKTSVEWATIGILVGGIHLYYLPMCAMLLGGYTLCSFIINRGIRLKFCVPGIAFMAGVLGNTYILGGFSSSASAEGDGLGEYSFNLNGFFNSKGYSRIFDVLPTYKDGQYEGFAYLGLGIFILAGAALVYGILRIIKKNGRVKREQCIYIVVYILMSAGLILFAASPEVTWNDRLIFEYPYSSTLYHLWGIFRSTGRIIWPVCYFIYIGVIVCSDRLWKALGKKQVYAILILIICVAAQYFDLSEKLGEQRGNFDKIEYSTPLQSELWSKLAKTETVKHIVWVSNNFENREIIHFARYADENNWTMNNFYFARDINVREYTEECMKNLNESCIYIFCSEDEIDYDLNLYEADGYIIGTTFLIE
jgi:hypothetical protein